jgi:hypothetical protein
MRIHQLVEELRNIEHVPGHKSALDIRRILEGNRQLFLQYLEKPVYEELLQRFDELSTARSGHYQTAMFAREFETAYGRLMFYLEKII